MTPPRARRSERGGTGKREARPYRRADGVPPRGEPIGPARSLGPLSEERRHDDRRDETDGGEGERALPACRQTLVSRADFQ